MRVVLGYLAVYVVILGALPVVAVGLGGVSRSAVVPLGLFAVWIIVAVTGPGVIGARLRRAVREVNRLYVPDEPVQVAALTESRREIVAAFEIERRRIERDLHDGAQQYLVTASMGVGEAALLLESVVEDGRINEQRLASAKSLLAKAQDDSEAALAALRHTVAGIHPKVLSDLGLEAAVRDLAADSPLDVSVRVPIALPEMTEGVIAAGYFLVAEALTNVAKYAPGAHVSILVAADDDLHISIVDDGPGGAVIRPDHGLAGLRERLASFGGDLVVVSPAGGPTTVSGRIPLLLREGEFGVGFGRVGDEGERR
ncbi:sensor histidine kinase [Arcanobacterium haemolyticum]|nr:sensor histidine kinase [Arcanobacterium haemolyticum]